MAFIRKYDTGGTAPKFKWDGVGEYDLDALVKLIASNMESELANSSLDPKMLAMVRQQVQKYINGIRQGTLSRQANGSYLDTTGELNNDGLIHEKKFLGIEVGGISSKDPAKDRRGILNATGFAANIVNNALNRLGTSSSSEVEDEFKAHYSGKTFLLSALNKHQGGKYNKDSWFKGYTDKKSRATQVGAALDAAVNEDWYKGLNWSKTNFSSYGDYTKALSDYTTRLRSGDYDAETIRLGNALGINADTYINDLPSDNAAAKPAAELTDELKALLAEAERIKAENAARQLLEAEVAAKLAQKPASDIWTGHNYRGYKYTQKNYKGQDYYLFTDPQTGKQYYWNTTTGGYGDYSQTPEGKMSFKTQGAYINGKRYSLTDPKTANRPWYDTKALKWRLKSDVGEGTYNDVKTARGDISDFNDYEKRDLGLAMADLGSMVANMIPSGYGQVASAVVGAGASVGTFANDWEHNGGVDLRDVGNLGLNLAGDFASLVPGGKALKAGKTVARLGKYAKRLVLFTQGAAFLNLVRDPAARKSMGQSLTKLQLLAAGDISLGDFTALDYRNVSTIIGYAITGKRAMGEGHSLSGLTHKNITEGKVVKTVTTADVKGKTIQVDTGVTGAKGAEAIKRARQEAVRQYNETYAKKADGTIDETKAAKIDDVSLSVNEGTRVLGMGTKDKLQTQEVEVNSGTQTLQRRALVRWMLGGEKDAPTLRNKLFGNSGFGDTVGVSKEVKTKLNTLTSKSDTQELPSAKQSTLEAHTPQPEGSATPKPGEEAPAANIEHPIEEPATGASKGKKEEEKIPHRIMDSRDIEGVTPLPDGTLRLRYADGSYDDISADGTTVLRQWGRDGRLLSQTPMSVEEVKAARQLAMEEGLKRRLYQEASAAEKLRMTTLDKSKLAVEYVKGLVGKAQQAVKDIKARNTTADEGEEVTNAFRLSWNDIISKSRALGRLNTRRVRNAKDQFIERFNRKGTPEEAPKQLSKENSGENLIVERQIVNGIMVERFSNGDVVYTFEEGRQAIKHPDGTRTHLYPDGTIIKTDSEGNTISSGRKEESKPTAKETPKHETKLKLSKDQRRARNQENKRKGKKSNRSKKLFGGSLEFIEEFRQGGGILKFQNEGKIKPVRNTIVSKGANYYDAWEKTGGKALSDIITRFNQETDDAIAAFGLDYLNSDMFRNKRQAVMDLVNGISSSFKTNVVVPSGGINWESMYAPGFKSVETHNQSYQDLTKNVGMLGLLDDKTITQRTGLSTGDGNGKWVDPYAGALTSLRNFGYRSSTESEFINKQFVKDLLTAASKYGLTYGALEGLSENGREYWGLYLKSDEKKPGDPAAKPAAASTGLGDLDAAKDTESYGIKIPELKGNASKGINPKTLYNALGLGALGAGLYTNAVAARKLKDYLPYAPDAYWKESLLQDGYNTIGRITEATAAKLRDAGRRLGNSTSNLLVALAANAEQLNAAAKTEMTGGALRSEIFEKSLGKTVDTMNENRALFTNAANLRQQYSRAKQASDAMVDANQLLAGFLLNIAPFIAETRTNLRKDLLVYNATKRTLAGYNYSLDLADLLTEHGDTMALLLERYKAARENYTSNNNGSEEGFEAAFRKSQLYKEIEDAKKAYEAKKKNLFTTYTNSQGMYMASGGKLTAEDKIRLERVRAFNKSLMEFAKRASENINKHKDRSNKALMANGSHIADLRLKSLGFK